MSIDPRNFIQSDDTEPPKNVVAMPPYVPPVPKAAPAESRSMPCALGVEKSVLSVLLQYPDKSLPEAIAAGLTKGHFYIPAHATLFGFMVELHSSGTEIEFVSLVQRLLDCGLLDRVGGPSAITDLYTYAPTHLYFTAHLTILEAKHAARQAIARAGSLVEEIYDTPEDAGAIIARFSEDLRTLATGATRSGGLLERAYALSYNPASRPPADEVLMSLGDAPAFAAANLTVLQGKSKVGKSSVTSALLGASMRGNYSVHSGDCLGFEWGKTRLTGRIIHFDTEQSPADWHGMVTRSVVRAGTAAGVPRLLSIPLVQFSRAERLSIIRGVIEREAAKPDGISIVLIDGVADICKSPNDEEEALELVASLMAIAHEFDIPIGLVLHENPGTDQGKTRGHLGSELNRKAFANLRVEKDEDGVSLIYGTDMRKKDIPKSQGICFSWSEEARMHTVIGTAGQVKAARIEEHKGAKMSKQAEVAEEVFAISASMGYAALVARIEDVEDVEKRTAERRVKTWKQAGIITQNGNGYYTLNR